MMTGSVQELRATVNVPFRFAGLPDISIEFVVDTGFEGALTLSPEAIAALNLTFWTKITAKLADARSADVLVYRAVVVWDGEEAEVAVLAMGTRPLLGTALLQGRLLEADFREGGLVRITSP